MLGSMIAVAAASLLKVDLGSLPSYSKAIVQVILGAILGLGLRNMDLQQLKSLLIPAAIITGLLLITGFIISFILNRFFGFDMMTAIFSSTPGGMTELSMVATEMNADSPVVAILQLIRLMSILLLVVPIAKLITR
jgi:membrane AbrB-like protein